MKVVLDESFWDENRQVRPNLDETVPHRGEVWCGAVWCGVVCFAVCCRVVCGVVWHVEQHLCTSKTSPCVPVRRGVLNLRGGLGRQINK